MRVFSKKQLENCSRVDLERKLSMVKTNDELSQEEIRLNVAEIEFFLNGGVRSPNKEAIDDILDCQADISDMGGN